MARTAEGRRGVRWHHIAIAFVAVSASLTPAAFAGSGTDAQRAWPGAAAEDEQALQIHTDQEALAMDTARFAESIGVTLEEASSYISRRALIEELALLLRERASKTFSDLYIAYDPYRIVVLTLGDGREESELVSAESRFQEILPFIEVRRVDYTETLLVKAMEQVGRLAGEAGTGTQAASADIRAGTITVWVDSDGSAAALMEAVRSADASGQLLIPAGSVNVLVGAPTDEDSFAGNDLNR